MFECLDDAAVVDVLTSAARAENVACARRFAAMGELYARRAPEDDTERAQWAIDGFENVVAEIGAALGITRGRAAAQLETAISLRDELPKVAKVFATEVAKGLPPMRRVGTARSKRGASRPPAIRGCNMSRRSDDNTALA